MYKAMQIIIIISLLLGCGGNIAWKHPNYSSDLFDTDNNECQRKAKELAAFSPQQSTYRQTTPGMVGYTTAQLNAAAADNLSNAIIGAIKTGTIYRPEYKKCMKAKDYYEDVESLIDDLKDDKDYVIRMYAATTLGKIRDPRGVELLIEFLQDDIGVVRGNAALALGKIKDARAVEPLIVSLRDRDAIVRGNAAEALGEIKDPRAVDPLLNALSKDKKRKVQQKAAEALNKITGQDYAIRKQSLLEQLIEDLNDDNDTTKWKASQALIQIGKPAVAPLIEALKDEDAGVRWRAADALRQIKDIRAVEHLINALKDEHSGVRWNAALALRSIQLTKTTVEEEYFGEDPVKWQEWWEKNKSKYYEDARNDN